MALSAQEIIEVHNELVAVTAEYLQPVLDNPADEFYFTEPADTGEAIAMTVCRAVGETGLFGAQFTLEVANAFQDSSQPDTESVFARVYNISPSEIGRHMLRVTFYGENFTKQFFHENYVSGQHKTRREAKLLRQISRELVDLDNLWDDVELTCYTLQNRTFLSQLNEQSDEESA